MSTGMHRRQFRKLAEVVYDLGRRSTLGREDWLLLARELARVRRSENDRFDEGKFYDACGIEPRSRP